jgi:hypothetical protein
MSQVINLDTSITPLALFLLYGVGLWTQGDSISG